ncbi:hypothetical protein PSP6_80097 [Paraburkholderia tropica]|nr:hypothetical protein PSP6_80097 [Paraburkholderia tropica]
MVSSLLAMSPLSRCEASYIAACPALTPARRGISSDHRLASEWIRQHRVLNGQASTSKKLEIYDAPQRIKFYSDIISFQFQ